MRYGWVIASGWCLAVLVVPGEAQSRYPRVYGSTGRPYGPTQAHYQYERQYGRPWHGYGGNSYGGNSYSRSYYGSDIVYGGNFSAGFVAPPLAYPVPYATVNYGAVYYGAGGWPVDYGYANPWPVVAPPALGLGFYSPGVSGYFGIYGTPGVYVPTPDHQLANPQAVAAPLQDALRENEQRWGENLPPAKPDPVTRPIAPSSTTAKLRSLEAQQRGDAHLRAQQWMLAYHDYKKAVDYAEDQPQAHWRLGLVLLMLQHYDSAAISLKRAVYLDPQFPQSAPPLTEVFGADSTLARTTLAHKLAEYVRQDIRDPDRLFLLGAMLHFEGDTRAREVLETGWRLAGRGQHFEAFLQAEATPPAAVPAATKPSALPPLPSGDIPLPPAPLPDAEPNVAPAPESVAPAVFEGPRLGPPGE